MLRKVLIKNYRSFKDFKLEFSRGVNIIVGSNDAGKSTLLEAINLALTARLHGYTLTRIGYLPRRLRRRVVPRTL